MSRRIPNEDIESTSLLEDRKIIADSSTVPRYPKRSHRGEVTTNDMSSDALASTNSKVSHNKRKAVSVTKSVSKFEAGSQDSSSNPRKQMKAGKAAPKKAFEVGRGTRITDKHILFWGGVLSNWNLGATFPGRRMLDLLIPRLAEHGVDHPRETAISTNLLEHHDFVCGEQAMMACKAWLFERDPVLEQDVEELELNNSGSVFDVFQDPSTFSSVSLPNKLGSLSNLLTKARKTCLWQILINSSPRDQKALGRKTPNFSPDTWSTACVPVVVSVSIARAECEDDLKRLYLKVGHRRFVEGSPVDQIWGVGLKWDDPRADVEENWRGTNLLGICHDQAAAFLQEVTFDTTEVA